MPLNNAGLSAMAGLSLFMSSFVFAYLNATTTSYFWSLIYIGGVVVCAIGSASKLSTAVGITGGLARVADAIASIVPLVAIVGVALLAIHYNADGVTGFMAGFAIITLVFLIAFGIADTAVSWFGGKYRAMQAAANEASLRMAAAADALRQSHGD